MTAMRPDPVEPTSGPVPHVPSAVAADTERARRFRPELQGLRALAVLLVVAYHVWFGRVSGGVDVFFVISGFLITGQLFRSAARGRLRFRPMWARQAARLLPAAFTVLLACAVAGGLLLPEARWQQTLHELFASAVFLENWRLAADSVDYAAQHNTQSVVQHFWSLSIQVQFYIVWPLLIALVALVAGQARERLRAHLLLTLSGLFAASLTFSVALTITNQPLAYFHSLTRVWEFALGGMLALTIDAITLPRRWRIALGWLGVVGLVACGALLRVDAVFPGVAALWPTGAACLVLVAGMTGSRIGADRILASRPAKYLGDLSYALYLWHWPVLIFFLVVRDQETVGLRGGLAIVAVSVALAVLTHHLVEEPIRRAPLTDRARWRGAAAGLAVVLLAGGVWQFEAAQRANETATVGDPDHPGAMAVHAGSIDDVDPSVELIPPMVTAPDDFYQFPGWACGPMTHYPTAEACTMPRPDPAVPPAKRIVVVGDSHSQQYTAALAPVAQRNNWELVDMLKGACPFSTASEVDPANLDCLNWNAAVVDEIADLHPDAVFTLASRDVRAGVTEVTPPGFVAAWQRMNELGIPVIAVRDNPRFDQSFSPPNCLQQRGRGAPECGLPRADVYGPIPPYQLAPDVPPNVTFLDFSDHLCDASLCPAEIGNVLVYMDFNHVSATYMTSLAPVMEERLHQALGW
ncbi:acyltransferase [Pseudonocardia kujensis]|uniref:acyltransferase family protein n=1 Tax=Pseudonocardia kujensis TaxID=1128675 RepID=UPI001E46D2C5|nr:acyltransferase family protein [Pseudonocardia kujensis]MCE0768649.1 acyltransferase [Pseudonocardia kujensis]